MPSVVASAPTCGVATWRGGGGSRSWSDPANWAGGRTPVSCQVVLFDTCSGDAVADAGFEGAIGGIILEGGYRGTVRLERGLQVLGEVRVAGGTLWLGPGPLVVVSLVQAGGRIEGEGGELRVDRAASVTGGVLETPRALMSVETLAIRGSGVVRMAAGGKLQITGDGEPLVGDGLLDATTNGGNSVEYSGQVTTNLSGAGPLAGLCRRGVARATPPLLRAGVGRGTAAQPSGAATLGPTSGFSESASAILNGGEDLPYRVLIDSGAGYGYVGTVTSPGIIVKVRLSDFTRVGALTLPPGMESVYAGVIDPSGGFAYFGTGPDPVPAVPTLPASIVRIRLSDFTVAGFLTLNDGESKIMTAAIDTAGGFAYFGAYTAPGIIVKVRLSDFTRVGALTLADGEDRPRCSVIDPASGFAYFGTETYPGIVVRVRLADFARVDALVLNDGEDYLESALLDAAAGNAYFAGGNPGFVVKVGLSDLSRVGSLPLDAGEGNPLAAVIDPSAGFAYFGTVLGPPVLIKVRLSDLSRVGTVSLDPEGYGLIGAALDAETGLAYFTTWDSPGTVIKVQLSDLTRVADLRLLAGADNLASAVADTSAGFAYLGSQTSPGLIVKVRLSDLTEVGRLTLATDSTWASTAAIDLPAGYAYFVTGGSPVTVVRIQLSDFTQAESLALTPSAEGGPIVIDSAGGFAYVGLRTNPGTIVKVRLSDFSEVASTTLALGEDSPATAAIDPVGGFAYFGTNTDPGIIVKVRLADLARVDAVTTAVPYLLRSGFDQVGGSLYFGSGNPTSASVAKVKLSDFTHTEDLAMPGYGWIWSCVIDGGGGFGYFGTANIPAAIVKVRLSDLAVVNALTLPSAESGPSSAVIDSVTGFAYFGTFTTAGRVVRIELGSTTTAVTSSVNPSQAGGTLTFTATVSPLHADAGTPGGMVDFTADGSPIAGCTALAPAGGQAQCTTSALAIGAHVIAAWFTADASWSNSAGTLLGGQLVNPSARITVPPSVMSGSSGNIASVPGAGTGATYAWIIQNGVITAGAGTPSVTFTAGPTGNVTLAVTVTSALVCSASGTATVPITSTVFSDGFEGTGWTVPWGFGAATWKLAGVGTTPPATPHSGSKLADFTAHTGTAGTQARLYRTTGFAVPAGVQNVALSFWMYHDAGAPSANDTVQAQVSTDGFRWVNVGPAVSRYAASAGWSQVMVDVTPYKGTSSLRLGFLGTSAHGNDCYLDDVAVTATGGPLPDFGLSASPAAVTAAQCGSATVAVTTSVAGGFSGGLALSASGMPAGATAVFAPPTIAAPGSGSSTLTLAAGSATPTGTYTVTVTASGGGLAHTAAVAFTVTVPNPPVTLSSDGFEGSGWTLPFAFSAVTWKLVTAGAYPPVTPHSGSKLADFAAHTSTAGAQARMYRTTGFAVPAGAHSVTLTFWMYHDAGAPAANDRVQAQVSTNGFTWVNVGAPVSRYAASPGWSQVTVDLTAYKGASNLRLGFLGTSAHGNDCYLDDIVVVAQ
ncbi:MAG TPA: choice-of-anchor J domain-containing protein [Thermoanaerobaculaceae bacterium]|nr:choice-of-anchor J domain-containing protein [Thermoanaerobaculaceae bacterium]